MLIVLATMIEAGAVVSSKLHPATSKNAGIFQRSKNASISQYSSLYKFLGGVKNTMIKNTNAKKQKIALKKSQTTSLRTKHVCTVCKFLVKRNGAKRKRCAIYLKINAHKCNPVMQSEFSSFV